MAGTVDGVGICKRSIVWLFSEPCGVCLDQHYPVFLEFEILVRKTEKTCVLWTMMLIMMTMGNCFGRARQNVGGRRNETRPTVTSRLSNCCHRCSIAFILRLVETCEGEHALGLRWAPSLEMASKSRTPLYQCLALSLVGSLVEKREQYVPKTSKVQGTRKVRQGHEGKMLWTKQGGRRARGNSTRLIMAIQKQL